MPRSSAADQAALERIHAQREAERRFIDDAVCALLHTYGEVTSPDVVDMWERKGHFFTDRRDAFTRVKRRLVELVDEGKLRMGELRHDGRKWPRRIYLSGDARC